MLSSWIQIFWITLKSIHQLSTESIFKYWILISQHFFVYCIQLWSRTFTLHINNEEKTIWKIVFRIWFFLFDSQNNLQKIRKKSHNSWLGQNMTLKVFTLAFSWAILCQICAEWCFTCVDYTSKSSLPFQSLYRKPKVPSCTAQQQNIWNVLGIASNYTLSNRKFRYKINTRKIIAYCTNSNMPEILCQYSFSLYMIFLAVLEFRPIRTWIETCLWRPDIRNRVRLIGDRDDKIAYQSKNSSKFLVFREEIPIHKQLNQCTKIYHICFYFHFSIVFYYPKNCC